MNNYMKTIISGIKEWVASQKSDWNQNSPDAANYIKNRTHYTEYRDVDVLSKRTFNGGELILKTPLVEGVTYTVEFNNVKYKCIAKYYDGWLMLGNNAIYEYDGDDATDTGEPFALEGEVKGTTLWVYLDDSITESPTLRITTVGEVVHKLDKKYLPEISNVGKSGAGKNSEIFNNYKENEANGNYSHAEGSATKAGGDYSHVEGYGTWANGESAHVEGLYSSAEGAYSHAEGWGNDANGESSHAEGRKTEANGDYSHSEGHLTITVKLDEGESVVHDAPKYMELYDEVKGYAAHAEGYGTVAFGCISHAEGNGTYAHGFSSHAEGAQTESHGACSHAEGNQSKASGDSAHAEGNGSIASEFASHAEGNITEASGICSHAEGDQSKASGDSAHAEGSNTIASGIFSHAEGNITEASGECAHAEGSATSASGECSHAEGNITEASGRCSHAEGYNTYALGECQHVQGKFNILDEDSEKNPLNTYAHIVGNGESYSKKSNAHTLDWDGNAWFAGDVYVGSTSGTNKDEGSKRLVTEDELSSYYLKTEADNLHSELHDYVDTEVAALVNAAPETLDTIGELAAAFEENKEVVEALDASITNKQDKISDTLILVDTVTGIQHKIQIQNGQLVSFPVE